MIRNLFIFLGTFVAGALIALVVRAAKFNAHAEHATAPAAAKEYSPLVSNSNPSRTSASDHSAHGTKSDSGPAAAAAKTSGATSAAPVNTVCAICGMTVDPNLPTLEYQGQKIGFGCKMCAPKFKADPDRYGPAYLRNEVIKR